MNGGHDFGVRAMHKLLLDKIGCRFEFGKDALQDYGRRSGIWADCGLEGVV
jgi:hypothetical protein